MPYVVTSPCVHTKDISCMKVCPVNCFFDAGQWLVIHPVECIDCGLCIPECPVNAIFPEDEVSEQEQAFIRLNKMFFEGGDAAEVDTLMSAAEKALATVTEPDKRAKIDAFLKNKEIYTQAKEGEALEKLRLTP
jgi:Fe-S-cluster-containing hydrogenase component 2